LSFGLILNLKIEIKTDPKKTPFHKELQLIISQLPNLGALEYFQKKPLFLAL